MPIGPSHPLAGVDRGYDGVAARVFRWLPYPLIAVSLVLTLVQYAVEHGHHPVPAVLALAVAAAAWTLALLGRGYDLVAQRRRIVGYFVVRLVLSAFLVVLAPWFGIYAWFGYVEAVRYFRLPRGFVAVAGAAAVASLSYVGGLPSSTSAWVLYGLIFVVSTVLVGFLAVNTSRSWDREAERERTLAELTVANDRLEAALTENRGLQEQLVAQAREAGVLDERARLAGEIHDTLAQALTGIITQLEAAERGGELARADGHVDRARALARSGLAEARRSLHALRPAPLVGSRLGDAIGETAQRWSTTSGLAVAVDVTGDVVALDTDREIALLRAAQEGLTNVEKHARASKVGLTLSYLGDEVLLDVRDDGCGFTPGDVTTGQDGHTVGLATMRDRLRRVGGDLAIESEPAGGTALVARVPTR